MNLDNVGSLSFLFCVEFFCVCLCLFNFPAMHACAADAIPTPCSSKCAVPTVMGAAWVSGTMSVGEGNLQFPSYKCLKYKVNNTVLGKKKDKSVKTLK